MKIKSFTLVSGLAMALIVSLTGCSFVKNSATKNPPSQRQQRCEDMQSQLNLSQSSSSMPGVSVGNVSGGNIATEASTMRMHDKYNCAKFENNK